MIIATDEYLFHWAIIWRNASITGETANQQSNIYEYC